MAKEDAKLAHKRQMFEERRLRIINAKARTMGLDVQTLDHQVAEKQKLKSQEKEANAFESKHFSSFPFFLTIFFRITGNGN
jgi:hypothetical protein